MSVAVAPSVWNFLPILSCLWNDVLIFWYIPLSVDIDWSPFLSLLPLKMPHIFYWLREVAAWAVLAMEKLRPVLPSEHRTTPMPQNLDQPSTHLLCASQCHMHGSCSFSALA